MLLFFRGSVINCKLKDKIVAQNEKVEGINTYLKGSKLYG